MWIYPVAILGFISIVWFGIINTILGIIALFIISIMIHGN